MRTSLMTLVSFISFSLNATELAIQILDVMDLADFSVAMDERLKLSDHR